MTPEDEVTESPPGLAALKCELAPQRDLWPGIESRIRARRARAWRAPLWAGALLAASVALVLGLSIRRETSNAAVPLRASAEFAAIAASGPRDPALVSVAQRPLHPETRALVRANIKLVNDAEQQVKRALVQDPDAAYLKSLLASARKQQVQLAALEDR